MSEELPLLSDSLTSEFGSKAYHLSRLKIAGYSVPHGFAIPPTLYARWKSSNCIAELNSKINVSLGQLDSQSEALIVRSSALGEDGISASFAGQLLSLKCKNNRADVVESIVKCWRAIEEGRVELYGNHVGVRLSGLGIVVQEFIEATISGVAFTRSPLGGDHLLIEYCDGDCHKLVSGQTKPNRINLSKTTFAIEKHNLNGQSKMSDALTAQLHKACLGIEELFGMPMDIEWVFSPPKGLQIVQARPITVTPETTRFCDTEGTQMLWTNSNMAENYPEPACPLLFSIARRSYECYFRELARAFGVSSQIIHNSESELSALVGSHKGHLYYNLSNVIRIFSRVPFSQPLIDAWCRFLGINQTDFLPWTKKTSNISWHFFPVFSASRMLIISCLNLSTIPFRLRRFEGRVEKFFATTRELSSTTQINTCLQTFSDIRFRFWLDSSLCDALTMLSTGALRFLAERWMESHKAKSFVQLSLAGIDRLESKKPLDELSKIEQLIRRNTDAVQVFHTSDAHEIISKLRDNKNTKDVVRALEEYIAKWGFRFGGELLLNRKSWIEDSTELMNQMKKRLQGKNEYDPQSESQNKATCLSGIKLLPSKVNLGRTILLRCLARLSRSAVRLRERSRLKQAQLYCGLRFTALAAGKRLKHHKLIGQIDDVFYLEFDELRAMMLGSYHLPSTVHELISCRKKFLGADRFANKQERIIQTLEQWWLSTTLSFPSSFGSSTPETYDILYGTGASRGIAEAEASVIESLDDIERVKRDSILVTRFTDPGWSSVFPIVRGLVLERGGLLCHGAIIAREYGIPTITDVEDATQKIKDGQLLKIDGNSGTVKFV